MTFGTNTGHPPDDVINATGLPVCTGVPTEGFVPTTKPVEIVFEHVVLVTEPGMSWDWANFVAASTGVKPLTFGMGYFAPDDRIVKLTTSPDFALVPAGGV
jgi:hypothetical protein